MFSTILCSNKFNRLKIWERLRNIVHSCLIPINLAENMEVLYSVFLWPFKREFSFSGWIKSYSENWGLKTWKKNYKFIAKMSVISEWDTMASPRAQHRHNRGEMILIPPTDATAPLVGRPWRRCCVTVQRAAEQPGCPCWPPGSCYRRKKRCKSWRRGQRCLWRCKAGHPEWPGCSRWSERKHISSDVVQ